MSEAELWKEYDLAKQRLSVVIGDLSELMFQERRKPAPDYQKIVQWEKEQEALIDKEENLTVTDSDGIQAVNQAYAQIARAIMRRA